MRESGLQQCLVEAAQVAHAVDEAETALRVEVEQAVACGQAQIEQGHAMPRAAAQCFCRCLRRLGQLVVEHERQAGRERGHADARSSAQQRDGVSARADRQAAAAVEQLAQRVDRIRGRCAHVDEIVHAGTQCGQHRRRLS
ncbi:hypothetical protein D9M68_789900 [compost metagenome]